MNLRTSIYERIFQIKSMGRETPIGAQGTPLVWTDRKSAFKSESINKNVLIQKSINDVNLITNGISTNLFFLLRGSVFATGGLSMILLYFPQLLGVASLYLAFFVLRSNGFNQRLQKFSKQQIESLEKVSAFFGEGLDNGYRLRQQENTRFFQHKFNLKLLQNHEKVLNLARLFGAYIRFLESFGVGLVVGIMTFGSYSISVGTIASGDVLLSLYAVYGVLGLRSINNAISEFKIKIGILESLEEFLETKLEASFDETKKGSLNSFFANIEAKYTRLKEEDKSYLQTVSVKDLQKSQNLVEILDYIEEFNKSTSNPLSMDLENIHFLPMGETTPSTHSPQPPTQTVLSSKTLTTNSIYAFSGESGTGKTSLMRLILGQESIVDGNVLFYPSHPEHLISTFYMPQITSLFSSSILFNVLTTNLPLLKHLQQSKFPPEDVALCLIAMVNDFLRKVNLTEKIEQMSLDEDTMNLSGGEKQRVCLAGMLFSNADLVLIDEATASLDQMNVELIKPVLKEFLSTRLSIVISHDQQLLDFLVQPQNNIILTNQ